MVAKIFKIKIQFAGSYSFEELLDYTDTGELLSLTFVNVFEVVVVHHFYNHNYSHYLYQHRLSKQKALIT